MIEIISYSTINGNRSAGFTINDGEFPEKLKNYKELDVLRSKLSLKHGGKDIAFVIREK